ncbi:MAG: hypothetical protein WB608_10535 [Terracidiphilus sp.]
MEAASQTRGVLTLAYGHRRFVEQAKFLGMSLQLHAPHVPRTLVTDFDDPKLRSIFTQVIPHRPEFGSGVRQKLYLDQYSPYDETLFIDSDCLALGNLDAFWTAFAGQYFGVPGFRYLHKGSVDSFIDVDFLLDHLGLSSLPKFNGGTYYFTRSAEASAFFDTARKIMDNWRELRLAPFRRNGPNDESVYSVAMAMHNVSLTYMGCGGMWTPCGYSGKLSLDGIHGTCSFEKEGEIRTPEVIHFPGEYIYCFPYVRECARIRKQVGEGRQSVTSLVRSYALSILWQCSRKSATLSDLGRRSIRIYRAATRSLRMRSSNS